MGLLSKLFPSYNDKELKKISKIVDVIESLEDKYKAMSDEELRACTDDFKSRIADGATLDELLPEAFAVVREASSRVLGMRHYRVQLVGGVVLHQGRIAEMRTGEGKTLVATLPAYLNALSGKGMHVVTVNEYLATRDAEWMGKIYKFLGLTVGVNLSQMTIEQKQSAYNCDIMYTTNNELGFDYLRDNMAKSKSRCVQRDLAFAIVDEVDSILIDEARTPLIISGRGEKSSQTYTDANRFVKSLIAKHDKAVKEDERAKEELEEGEEFESLADRYYEVNEKDKTVFLNDLGAEEAEKYFHVDNLADYENQSLKHYIDNALKANLIMKRDSNYLVVDGEVIIIDEFTGRKMIGRRYSDGLHQAIEAKENVNVRAENKTMATITFQNFFRLYKKLSGMTGTAKTEETEFKSIYNLDVVVIPTNLPIARVDEDDLLYVNLRAKYNAIIADVKKCYEKKQPVLIGTVSVEKSEQLSAMLKRAGIPHNVLNAKNHESEAEIVAQAGRSGAVTVATNMAGRGTDILLGGNPEFLAKKKLENLGYPHDIIEEALSFAKTDDEQILKAKAEYKKYYDAFNEECQKEKQEVISVGGLRIIGTERHESRRIDNQLRGRSGRQGDVGSSVFYLSMEDDIMRLFGGEQMQAVVARFAMDENMPVSAKIITRQIENAQARVEDRNFSIRKHVIGYDDVMNKQREIIYEQRRMVLDGMRVHEQILAMMKAVAERLVGDFVDYKTDHREWDYDNFNKELEKHLLAEGTALVTPDYIVEHDNEEALIEAIYEAAVEQYQAKIDEFDATARQIKEKEAEEGRQAIVPTYEDFERDILLSVVDNKWTDHIDEMARLKQGISLVQYAQRDPVLVYKQEGYEMFDQMVENIQNDVVMIATKANITITSKSANNEHKNLTTGDKPKTVVREGAKINRNDPCPCGSDKKYKNCCGKNQ